MSVARPGRSTVVSSLDVRATRDARDVVTAMHELAVREAIDHFTAAVSRSACAPPVMSRERRPSRTSPGTPFRSQRADGGLPGAGLPGAGLPGAGSPAGGYPARVSSSAVPSSLRR
ncbi:hypothetical protein GCM10023152_08570 [Agromyces bauzanensis]|uniref:Uncharacterized protein n=1 Tax=Agromyces bauzanensis TaxID=1308924 RepID=A0A917PQI3_9MICO|nr:hypothetical protein GCM10011372_27880 [Agromyces bauzanensis]